MKVRVDPDRCDAYGECERIAPRVFKVEGDNVVVTILIPGEIPEDYEGHVIRAVERCPKAALTLNVDLYAAQ